MSTIRSSRRGRNSCSGGSSVRIVTGSPSIALKTPAKSSRCIGSSFLQSAIADGPSRCRQNHRAHVPNLLFAEEHMLGAAKTDSFRPKRPRLNRIPRNVCIGTNLHLADTDRPTP